MAGKHAVKWPPGKDWQTRAEIQVRGVVTSVLGNSSCLNTARGALISPLAAWKILRPVMLDDGEREVDTQLVT